MLGHEPAPLAILDCVELGLMQPMDGAIRAEMSVFAGLIQRPEPRNMIRSMFLGKQAYDKARRSDAISPEVTAAAETIGHIVAEALDNVPALRSALFGGSHSEASPIQQRPGQNLWLLTQGTLVAGLANVVAKAREITFSMDEKNLLQLDHLVTVRHGVPAYIGGVSGLATLPC